MAYADYEFYQSKYFGSVVPVSDFDRVSERASDFIDNITYERLVEKLPDNERAQAKIKKAVCAVADEIYKIEQAEKLALSAVTGNGGSGGAISGIVTSKSSGSESIGYASLSDISGFSAAFESSKSEKEINNHLYAKAKEYLTGLKTDSGILLLYSGTR